MEENNKKNGKPIFLIILMILIVIAIIIGIVLCFKMKKGSENNNDNKVQIKEENSVIENKTDDNEVETSEINIIPTMEDKVSADAAWCPTFQLVWNDMIDEVVKKDVEFIDGNEPDYLENLNNEIFKEENISEDLYYKTYGIKSNELKDEILKGIKDKFDETSDIINENDDWDEWKSEELDKTHYIFYSMLKRNFNFIKEFEILDKGDFGDKYKNVEYFGVDEDTEDGNDIMEQVDVLYYESDDKFAISVNTQEGDEVIFAKGFEGDTFNSIYNNVTEKSENFDGDKQMQYCDKIKIPNLNIDLTKEYEELKNKDFLNSESKTCRIEQAIQTIQLELNNKGGEIKSEALVEMVETTALAPEVKEIKPRNFYLDSDFVMFVKEGDKDLPYFALKVSDISKYQDGVEK